MRRSRSAECARDKQSIELQKKMFCRGCRVCLYGRECPIILAFKNSAQNQTLSCISYGGVHGVCHSVPNSQPVCASVRPQCGSHCLPRLPPVCWRAGPGELNLFYCQAPRAHIEKRSPRTSGSEGEWQKPRGRRTTSPSTFLRSSTSSSRSPALRELLVQSQSRKPLGAVIVHLAARS